MASTEAGNNRLLGIPANAPGTDARGNTSADNSFDFLNDSLTEDQVLAVLKRPDLSTSALEQLMQNPEIIRLRKVRFAVAVHPHTPRRIGLRLIRELYTFDLMRLAMLPGLNGELRAFADRTLIGRLDSLTLGERISLARRASLTVAAALLADKEPRVWLAALENPRVTEAAIVKTIRKAGPESALVATIRNHPRWSLGQEIRQTLEQWA